MTNINLLKDELIKRNIVNENEYLEAYLNLIENSLKNRCGDAHHSIPINTYAEVPCAKQYFYKKYNPARFKSILNMLYFSLLICDVSLKLSNDSSYLKI